MGRHDDGWHLDEGELLAPGLSALRRLGGGAAYEAWLCFDEVTWSPVVVKVLRPSQVEDESSRRGLRREVLALATGNHPGAGPTFRFAAASTRCRRRARKR